ncbi:MAG: hypothetical protein FVQ83_13790 [Chloroflexi bacterium]|nr:hypothetical protein [Chloroflexota bacterium]
MSIVGVIVAGIVATMVFSMILAMAPKMGLPEMDIVGLLGSMFGAPSNRMVGWVIHFMMGVVFAFIYALVWNSGIAGEGSIVASGALFGAVHWLLVGPIMGMVPMMHAGIKSGAVTEPGVYMTKNGGMMAFMGGLVGHIIFGLVVALVYNSYL